jgi:carbonic anhydrase
MPKAPRLNSLLVGNVRFQTVFKQNRGTFLELLKGQTPRALYIGCADSRVVPNFIIDAGPGEVFVVRNVGAVVPPPGEPDALGIAAAVEFAVFHLNVPHVVVCAHDHCGALKGILGGVDVTSPLGEWLTQAAGEIPKTYSNGAALPLNTYTELFVRMQHANLLAHDIAQRAVTEKNVRFSAWVYNPENGRIRELSDDGTFHEHVAGEQPTEVWQK